MAGVPRAAPLPLDVVEAARAGDGDAITQIYRALAPTVIGYLRGAGAPDPENLAGDVFVGVIESLSRFAGDGAALRTWTFTIAHRRLIDDRRRRRRRPEERLDRTADDVVQYGAVDDIEAVLGAINARPVRRALGSLTTDQRNVLVLRVVGELSLAETAHVLGKPVAAVKMLQRRALDALVRRIPQAAVT